MSRPETIFIYALLDPRTDHVCYVGKSIDSDYRLSQHYSGSPGQDKVKIEWINELRSLNLRPEMVILEETDEQNWRIRERYWIDTYLAEYAPLLNCKEGRPKGEETVKLNTQLPRRYNEMLRRYAQKHDIPLTIALKRAIDKLIDSHAS